MTTWHEAERWFPECGSAWDRDGGPAWAAKIGGDLEIVILRDARGDGAHLAVDAGYGYAVHGTAARRCCFAFWVKDDDGIERWLFMPRYDQRLASWQTWSLVGIEEPEAEPVVELPQLDATDDRSIGALLYVDYPMPHVRIWREKVMWDGTARLHADGSVAINGWAFGDPAMDHVREHVDRRLLDHAERVTPGFLNQPPAIGSVSERRASRVIGARR